MRPFILLSLIALAACSQGEETGEPASRPSGTAIACALAGAATFDAECVFERVGQDVIVHHPDGSFRRFRLDPDGGGLVAADGADDAAQQIEGEWLILSVGGDRYRLPFTPIADDNG